MDQRAVVIGDSAGARRAAAGLSVRGWDVTLVETRTPEAEPVVPSRGDSPLATQVLGATGALSSARSVWVGGRLRDLPLSAADLARALPAGVLAGAARAWGRARGTLELKKLVGGGNETRTYRDWVVHGFGAPIHDVLFAPYARKRWGDPSALSCNVARLHHAWAPASARVRVAGDAEPSLSDAPGAGVRRVRATRAAVHVGENGGPARVETDAGTFEGTVFADVAPAALVSRIAAVPAQADRAAALRADADALPARDLIEVRVLVDGRVGETHVIDADIPFFLVDATGDGTVRAYAAVDPGTDAEEAPWVARAVSALARMGVEAGPRGARVLRSAAAQPVWSGPHLSRLRRHVIALAELGVVPVGRAGMHAMLDPVAELAWVDAAQAALAEDKPARALREAMRVHVEPPPEDPPERPRLAELVLA